MTLLRVQVEANPCQKMEELSNALNQPWSTIQEHLQQNDEEWVLYDNPNHKRQWLSLKEPPRRTAKPDLHPKKTLLYVLWSIRGIVHFEEFKPGETVMQTVIVNG
ncbi:histone-lysine N-methyltransferase SETMAR [Trichonephila clavipes]|uniref:Histone-lysine N-methyltransferase SETMAR n=1 Tax=Trichonephila clavipes TaxID=2585209 RepID=A0A8X6S7N0_TRICX|nr:histone-lysine N-methyltransferase SETMAR [Trichonephila clavipes]